jgi:hypothetical protein
MHYAFLYRVTVKEIDTFKVIWNRWRALVNSVLNLRVP